MRAIGKASTSNALVKELTIEAVVTRADGTVENLGVVAHSKFGPLARIARFWRECHESAKRMIHRSQP